MSNCNIITRTSSKVELNQDDPFADLPSFDGHTVAQRTTKAKRVDSSNEYKYKSLRKWFFQRVSDFPRQISIANLTELQKLITLIKINNDVQCACLWKIDIEIDTSEEINARYARELLELTNTFHKRPVIEFKSTVHNPILNKLLMHNLLISVIYFLSIQTL